MRKPLIIAGLLGCMFHAFSNPCVGKPNAQEVLSKLENKLNSLQTISYTYKRILDYPGEGYHNELVLNAYLDFDPGYQVIGLRYQFNNNDLLAVYNGSEGFFCDKQENTIETDNSPGINSFRHSSDLFNSPVTLKMALPGIIADQSIPKSLSDTVIDNKAYYIADITLKNKTWDALGGYAPTTLDLLFSYKIFIDKATYLPVEILQHTLNTKDTNITFFTNINEKPAALAETSWYSSTYDSFKPVKPRKKIDLINTGVPAPDSHLAFFISKKPVAISDFKGKVILLEFWIKDCGYCIEAVPKLNALHDKYKDKDFELLALNDHDTRDMIDIFLSKHTVKYDVLTGASTIDLDYGISGFPTTVLIGKDGKVIFAGELDQNKLETLIDQNI